MRVKFWGTRGTRPTPGRRTLRYGGNTTCIEVRDRENNLLIIDSGSGTAELGNAFSPTEPLQAHLLITHTHLDHIQGFPFFLPAFVPGTTLTIVGPGWVREVAAGRVRRPDRPRVLPGAPEPHARGDGVHRTESRRDV
jgi:phosphoribosyl 1,2-cyclic phosphodiesterase